MEPTCPKCSQQLPEVETLKYRFCPHCGTEIAPDLERHKEAFATIPPDLTPRRREQRLNNSHRDADPKKPTRAGRLNDQAINPQPMASRTHPKLKPPDRPPPASFFRTPSETFKPPAQDIHTQPPTKNRNKIIIAILISLAVVILIIGALFTF